MTEKYIYLYLKLSTRIGVWQHRRRKAVLRAHHLARPWVVCEVILKCGWEQWRDIFLWSDKLLLRRCSPASSAFTTWKTMTIPTRIPAAFIRVSHSFCQSPPSFPFPSAQGRGIMLSIFTITALYPLKERGGGGKKYNLCEKCKNRYLRRRLHLLRCHLLLLLVRLQICRARCVVHISC